MSGGCCIALGVHSTDAAAPKCCSVQSGASGWVPRQAAAGRCLPLRPDVLLRTCRAALHGRFGTAVPTWFPPSSPAPACSRQRAEPGQRLSAPSPQQPGRPVAAGPLRFRLWCQPGRRRCASGHRHRRRWWCHGAAEWAGTQLRRRQQAEGEAITEQAVEAAGEADAPPALALSPSPNPLDALFGAPLGVCMQPPQFCTNRHLLPPCFSQHPTNVPPVERAAALSACRMRSSTCGRLPHHAHLLHLVLSALQLVYPDC